MKVLHVFKTYLPDSFTGVERVIWEIAENTRPLGVTSEVLSLTAGDGPKEVAVGNHLSVRARQDVYVASTGLSLSLFGEFRRRSAAADIVHYHFPWPMMDLLQLLVPPRRPTIVTYHSDVVRQQRLLRLYTPLMNRFLSSVDRIVATSPNYLASSPVLQEYRDKTTVIPIGIGNPPTVDAGRRDALRAKVGEGFFLFVGALRYYKGLPVLLEAARLTGLPVVVAGKGEGLSLLTEAQLPNVKYLGEVDDTDKWGLLDLCRAFLFPSHLRSEAFGVALLEAARAGRAMISCEIGTGTSYINITGETGITIKPNDPEDLASAMQQVMADNEATKAMGQRARARYERLFTATEMAARYAGLYRTALRDY